MDISIMNNELFSKLNQFERKNLLKEHILTDTNCKIGTNIMCFESEIIVEDKNKYFYRYVKKVKSITVGKYYQIIDHKEGKIKILNDFQKNVWYTIDRFLYSIKFERKEKLKKLKNL